MYFGNVLVFVQQFVSVKEKRDFHCKLKKLREKHYNVDST